MHIDLPPTLPLIVILVAAGSFLALLVAGTLLLLNARQRALMWLGRGLIVATVTTYLVGGIIYLDQRENKLDAAQDQLIAQTMDRYGVNLSDIQAAKLLSREVVRVGSGVNVSLVSHGHTYRLLEHAHGVREYSSALH